PMDFVFRDPDDTTTLVSSPDPGRAVITGDASDPIESVNAFKIPSLWGTSRTAPYFHDNSAKTLEDVLRHYAQFFAIVTDPSIDGDPPLILTEGPGGYHRVPEAAAVSSRAVFGALLVAAVQDLAGAVRRGGRRRRQHGAVFSGRPARY
ncbi:MAG: hypothetical protein ACRDLY_18120, partial [Thermoleophilaceae bacterium]